MRRQGRQPGHEAVFTELDRIRAEERKLREAKIALLKRELTKARRVVRSLEKELRLLGDREATQSAGRISWDGTDTRGGRVAPGVLFVRVLARDGRELAQGRVVWLP